MRTPTLLGVAGICLGAASLVIVYNGGAPGFVLLACFFLLGAGLSLVEMWEKAAFSVELENFLRRNRPGTRD